jgi:two-component system, NtrC family, sensor kinase
MFFELVLFILIIRYLRKNLDTRTALPEWEKLFWSAVCASIVLIVGGTVFHRAQGIVTWIAHAMLLGVVYITYNKKEFAPAKASINSVLPLIIVLIISNIVKSINLEFYDRWDDYFQMGTFFAFVWLIAMWFITKRQRKALETEKIKNREKEKEFRITESLKAKLEVQVAERTAELTSQKEELQQTITELKATQAQLIQSEKMASLGELTAGIAHEIQNPLNFINNFSDVNTELIEEMNEAVAQGNMNEVAALAKDIADNEQKINHHGKRADAIVKGMLQHSRQSKGVKESTDINALADEYLRLAYHGLRAKDKTFNATMKTDFDPTIGKINMVPQDIGRVILNLITNAFYAVADKKKQANSGYEPTVYVTTKKTRIFSGANGIEIKVKDNGDGIPQHIVDKIFQPFFTTKPAGQGTGLGLSLSYDIIKAHGGEIRTGTKPGEGAEFIIQLPLS